MIDVRSLSTIRVTTMNARVACGNRVYARTKRDLFARVNEPGDLVIEDEFKRAKKADTTHTSLKAEEEAALAVLASALEDVPFYKHIRTNPATRGKALGFGPAIAGRIIGDIADIRRFPTASKFVAYLGAHVRPDGTFPKNKAGEPSNWDQETRKALYLLADQWVRNPGSYWNEKLQRNKAGFREKHPEVVIRPGTKIKDYTVGHINEMGIWRTVTQFARWFYGEWRRFERAAAKKQAEEKQKVAQGYRVADYALSLVMGGEAGCHSAEDFGLRHLF